MYIEKSECVVGCTKEFTFVSDENNKTFFTLSTFLYDFFESNEFPSVGGGPYCYSYHAIVSLVSFEADLIGKEVFYINRFIDIECRDVKKEFSKFRYNVEFKLQSLDKSPQFLRQVKEVSGMDCSLSQIAIKLKEGYLFSYENLDEDHFFEYEKKFKSLGAEVNVDKI